jgi:hypothetical protein
MVNNELGMIWKEAVYLNLETAPVFALGIERNHEPVQAG